MKPCAVILPNGNTDCKVAMPKVKRPYFADIGLSFATNAEVVNLTEWKEKINVDLSLFIVRGLTSYEVTTDDPNMITTEETQKLISNMPAPSGVFYLDSNYCDYKDLESVLNGGTYGIIYELADGSIFMMQRSDGTFGPFPARLNAIGKGIPEPSDIANNFRMYANHMDYKDSLKGVIIAPDWDVAELQLAMPAGLGLYQVTAYAATAVDVQVNERCGDGLGGLVFGDFEIINTSFLNTPAISAAVDNDEGSYSLTITKEAVPVTLAPGEWITIRVKKGSEPVSDLSNLLTIVAP